MSHFNPICGGAENIHRHLLNTQNHCKNKTKKIAFQVIEISEKSRNLRVFGGYFGVLGFRADLWWGGVLNPPLPPQIGLTVGEVKHLINSLIDSFIQSLCQLSVTRKNVLLLVHILPQSHHASILFAFKFSKCSFPF